MLIDPLNLELLDCVRPVRWSDPVPESGKYNLIAIGAGAGGLVSALGCAGVGGKVAIFEKAMFGGDCLNTGCVPSKAFIKAAKMAHIVKNSAQYGISTGQVDVDFGKVMESVRRKRTHIGHHDAVERFIRIYGIDCFLGEAKFLDKETVECNGKKIKFARAVVATGGRPRQLTCPGIESVKTYTSENIFNMTELPKKVVIVGGGPIGSELGQSFQRLGSEVTFLLRGPNFLGKEDPEAAETIK